MSAEARQQIQELDRRIRFKKLHDEARNTVEITFDQIIQFSHELYENFVQNSLVYISTLQEYIRETIPQRPQLIISGDPVGQRVTTPRQLSASQMCQLFKVVGIVTKSQTPAPVLEELVNYSEET